MTPSEMDRARTLAAEMLMERLADDAMELEEFERRLDQVNAADSVDAIAKILGDVAASRPFAPIPRVRSRAVEASGRAGLPPLQRRGRRGPIRQSRRSKVVLAFEDGSGRLGPWAPSRHVWVVNMLGGAVMDFREADLRPGVTELTVFCMMGEVEIIVPLDLQVEFGGLGIVGGFDCDATVGVSNPDAPTLRINGVSCLGRVTVSVRDQGEEVAAVRRATSRRRAESPVRDRPREARQRGPGPLPSTSTSADPT